MSCFKHKVFIFLLLSAFAFCLFPFTAQAAIVGVDFGQPGQNTPANWTSVTGEGTFNALIDETGVATDINLTVNDAGGATSNYNAAINAPTLPTHTNNLADISHNIYRSTAAETVQLTFTGLTPGGEYAIWVLGLRDGVGGANQRVSIDGATNITFDQVAASANLFINGELGSNAREFSSYSRTLAAAVDGSITITVQSLGELYSLAGVAIEAVPAAAQVPTLSQWGMILFSLVLALTAIYQMRQRAV
jgi:hypothetical protein